LVFQVKCPGVLEYSHGIKEMVHLAFSQKVFF
jgi:hypothetical protein